MGTAGDAYLRGLLGTSQAANGPETEVTDAEAKARAAERARVFNARFNPFSESGATATATMHGGGSGGGYRFDAETIKSKITQWEQLLDDLRKDGASLARSVEALRPPSPDRPATDQVAATSRSLNAAIKHNNTMQQYVQAYLDAMRKANGTYGQHDQDVAGGLYGAASDTGDLYR